MNFEQAIHQLNDTLIVVAEIQRRQAEIQKDQAEGIATLSERIREGMILHEQRMNHIDMRLAEITDKLDGLIGYMDGQRPN
jgi:hypothetical protein